MYGQYPNFPLCYSANPFLVGCDSDNDSTAEIRHSFSPLLKPRHSRHDSTLPSNSSTESFQSDFNSSDSDFYDIAYATPTMPEYKQTTMVQFSGGIQAKQLVCNETPKPSLSIETLPFEIRQIIAQECLQADAFHLCLSSKTLYQSTIERLYQCIIFDSAHRHFNKEVFYKRLKPTVTSDNDDKYFSYTSVRTVGGLRRCMKTLRSDSTKASYIKRFECLNSMDLPDLEIRQFVKDVFPQMPNLACLVWDASPEITVDLLGKIANTQNIRTLCLDLALRNDVISQNIIKMSFPMLTHLTLRPYLHSNFLKLIAQMIINSESTVNNLKALYLGRELHKSHEVGSGFAFASMNPIQGVVDNQAISSFFGTLLSSGLKKKLKLTHLGLDGIIVTGTDFEIIDRCVDFETISNLHLAGTDLTGEINEEQLHSHGPDFTTPRFLSNLASRLKNIKSLEMDWSEQVCDTVPTFLNKLPSSLNSLSVKIRWNESKSYSATWAQLCDQYIESIVGRHSNSLTQLALDAVEDLSFKDPLKPIPAAAIKKLTPCTKLTGLSVATPASPPCPLSTIHHLIHHLPHLKFFHQRNQHIKPYLGQNVSYRIEDWVRYRHIVEGLISAQLPSKSLEFIKLEDLIFDLSCREQPPVIREGLQTWFDENVFEPWEI